MFQLTTPFLVTKHQHWLVKEKYNNVYEIYLAKTDNTANVTVVNIGNNILLIHTYT